MYFDDVSRHAKRWNPSSNVPPLSSSADPAYHNSNNSANPQNNQTSTTSQLNNMVTQADTTTRSEMEKRMQEEKQTMIRKLLIGYDAKMASDLEDSESKRNA